MLRLHEFQIEVLDESATARFLDRLLDHWQANHAAASACFSTDELRALALWSIESAQQQERATEASMVLHADLVLSHSATQRRRPQ